MFPSGKKNLINALCVRTCATGGALAAAVARGGGFPFIAGGAATDLTALEAEVETFKKLAPPGTKWGLGLISYSALGINKVLDEVLARFKPNVMQFTAPPIYDESVIPKCKAAGALVFVTCNSVAEAKQAVSAGVASYPSQSFDSNCTQLEFADDGNNTYTHMHRHDYTHANARTRRVGECVHMCACVVVSRLGVCV